MKDLVIIGAGGYAKEISFLVQNRLDFNLIGFVDDSVPKNRTYWKKGFRTS